MRSRYDTGLCRVCCRRKNLNKLENIVRHSFMMRQCDGSNTRPAPNSIVRAKGEPHEHRPVDQDADTLQNRIMAMQDAIAAGIPKTSEDMVRARRTLENLKQQAGVVA